MMKNFREYCLPKSNVDLLLKKAMAGDLGPLEGALVDFFSELSMKKSKTSNARAHMSHIKKWILTHSQGKVDIGSPFLFKVSCGWLMTTKYLSCELCSQIHRLMTNYLGSFM